MSKQNRAKLDHRTSDHIIIIVIQSQGVVWEKIGFISQKIRETKAVIIKLRAFPKVFTTDEKLFRGSIGFGIVFFLQKSSFYKIVYLFMVFLFQPSSTSEY